MTIKQKLLKSLIATIGQNKICDSLTEIKTCFDILERELHNETKEEIIEKINDTYFIKGIPWASEIEHWEEIKPLLIKVIKKL